MLEGFGDKVRKARLRWFGLVQRRDSEYTGRKMLNLGLPGKRSRDRPKRMFMDSLNKDMRVTGVRGENTEDRV